MLPKHEKKREQLKIMLVHGYLLSQTGSNLYTQYLARELCRLGNDVYLLSQDDKIMDYDFVERYFKFNSGNSSVSLLGVRKTNYAGKCTAFQPDIGRLLPVFVKDDYKGFIVKTFLDLSNEEFRDYVGANLTAVKWLLSERDIDIMQLNHGVIFPYIVSKIAPGGRPPYIVVIHGSGIEFIIRKSDEYRRYAKIGLESATAIIAVSKYVKKLIIAIFGKELKTKIKLIPAGVDLSNFNLTEDKGKSLRSFQRVVNDKVSRYGHGFAQNTQGEMLKRIGRGRKLRAEITRIHQSYNDRRPDIDLPKKLATLAVKDRIILFVGKLMATKGVHLAIAAIPLVIGDSDKNIKLVIVGFGEQREALEILINAISDADIKLINSMAKMIDSKISDQSYLSSFFYRLRELGMLEAYLKRAVNLRQNIIFTGLLDHGETKYLEQIADIQLVISLLPEAFGLVVLEGAAAGAIPIIANHSGLKDLADVIEAESHLNRGFISVNLTRERIVFDLSTKISNILALSQAERFALSKRIAKVPIKKYSWRKTAAAFIDLYWNNKRAA